MDGVTKWSFRLTSTWLKKEWSHRVTRPTSASVLLTVPSPSNVCSKSPPVGLTIFAVTCTLVSEKICILFPRARNHKFNGSSVSQWGHRSIFHPLSGIDGCLGWWNSKELQLQFFPQAQLKGWTRAVMMWTLQCLSAKWSNSNCFCLFIGKYVLCFLCSLSSPSAHTY